MITVIIVYSYNSNVMTSEYLLVSAEPRHSITAREVKFSEAMSSMDCIWRACWKIVAMLINMNYVTTIVITIIISIIIIVVIVIVVILIVISVMLLI